jgi:hypothetical protein
MENRITSMSAPVSAALRDVASPSHTSATTPTVVTAAIAAALPSLLISRSPLRWRAPSDERLSM